MQWYEAEVAQLERAARSAAALECPAVFYGSSSVRMWDTLADDLESDCVLNRAFGGSTLAACVHFFERLIPPVRPCSLILYAGDNDLGDGQSVQQVVTSFDQFLQKVERYLGAIPLCVMAIKPSPARFTILDRIRQANSAFQCRLNSRRGSLFIDTVAPMLTPAGVPNAEYFLEDGLHLSREGYRLWADLLRPHRKQLLIKPKSGRNMNFVSSTLSET
jgi:lysophospholipase L1-like esterase